MLATLNGAAFAQDLTGKDLTGTWQGTIHLPNGRDAREVIKIVKDGGTLKATLFSIDLAPGLTFPSPPISVQGTSLTIQFPGIGAAYKATVAADGKSMTGTLTQGEPFGLDLQRAGEQTAWEIPAAPAAPKPMSSDVDPVFAVATIKLVEPPDTQGRGVGVPPGGRRINIHNYSAADLMTIAYQIHPRQISGAPGWFETDRYDIAAEPEQEGVPGEQQWRAMEAKLLADRFQLRFHREKKELPVYAITTAKLTQKLTPSAGDASGLYSFGFRGFGSLLARNIGMDDFAKNLARTVMDRPVVNQTGIPGKFDLTLDWRPDEFQFANFGVKMPAPSDNDSRPDLFTAFQQQLGLKLEATKAAVDVLVIDKAEHPSEN